MTTAYPGFGSKLAYSPTGAVYTAIAQLMKFAPQGSKQNIVDQKNILSPIYTQPLAVSIDSGDIDLEGVLDPSNANITILATLHKSMASGLFKVTLSNGTPYPFSALVSEYVPFDVAVSKYIAFSAKLRVQGALF